MNNEKEIMKYYNIDQTKVSPMCKETDTKKQGNIIGEPSSQTEQQSVDIKETPKPSIISENVDEESNHTATQQRLILKQIRGKIVGKRRRRVEASFDIVTVKDSLNEVQLKIEKNSGNIYRFMIYLNGQPIRQSSFPSAPIAQSFWDLFKKSCVNKKV